MVANADCKPTDRMYLVAQGGNIAALDLFPDGSIRPLAASPFPTGAGTFSIVASPDGKLLYVAPGQGLGSRVSKHQKNSAHVATYRVLDTGAVEQIGDEVPLPAGLTPVSMALSSDGKNLYLGVGVWRAGFLRGGVAHYRVDDAGLPSLAGPPVSLGRRVDGAAQPIISPNGKHLYVASVIAKALVRLDINGDGSVTGPVDRTKSSGIFPITPAFSADGRTLYVANEQSKSISAFRVADDGGLLELDSSPYPTGRIPHNPALSKDGRFIYFANTFSHNVTGYAIQTDGSLVALPASPYATSVGPATLSTSTDGRWLYVVSSPFRGKDKSVVVSSWQITETGDLVKSEHEPASTGLQFADGPSSLVLPVRT